MNDQGRQHLLVLFGTFGIYGFYLTEFFDAHNITSVIIILKSKKRAYKLHLISLYQALNSTTKT